MDSHDVALEKELKTFHMGKKSCHAPNEHMPKRKQSLKSVAGGGVYFILRAASIGPSQDE